MKISISFPGGVAVDANIRNHVVHTDQPSPVGADTAVSPFDLFLASMGTCMGFYALRFCQERELSTDGLSLTVETTRDQERKRLSKIAVSLKLPVGFPEKYIGAIQRAVDTCAVKKAVLDPPEFELMIS